MSDHTYMANQAGVDALNALADRLPELLDNIDNSSKKLGNCASDANGLGPHGEKINEILESIQDAVKTAKEPVDTLSERIRETAEAYQDIIDSNIYGSP